MSWAWPGWYEVKALIAHATGWPMDTLHVLAGVMLQLGAAALLRSSLRDLRPLLAVAVLTLANEAYDIWFERWPSLLIQVGEGLRDVIGTLFLPSLMTLVARRRPQLLTGSR